MYITVVICTHNRLNLLRKTVDSLNAAVQPENHTLDLLVVANACTDHTVEWLQQYAETLSPVTLTFLSEPTPGKSHALNKALGVLDCELVAFIDDDHRVDNHFFENIVKTTTINKAYSIFCGRILPDWDGSEPNWVHATGSDRIYPPPIPIYDQGLTERLIEEEGDQPGGGNLFIRQSLLKTIGKFSTELGPQGHNFGGGEDSEFLQRARNQGEQVLYTPEIIQYHYVDHQRLKLGHLLQLAYQRSRCLAGMNQATTANQGIPLYMWRKLSTYVVKAIFAFNIDKIRFYLVRIAATLGEIRALKKISL
jgi:glycosyltransferase involved in cell wall biosynthesis